jgi:hypothetical protein
VNDPVRGRIIWTDVTDRRGRNVGEHACIIIAPAKQGKPIKAIVVSSNLNISLAEYMVEMPWAKGRHPQTGFDKPCAAMCDWEVDVDVGDINKYGGLIYGPVFDDIVSRVMRARGLKKST